MYEPLLEALGDREAQTVHYPPDRCLGYDALEPWLRDRLPAEPFVLLAESFSGPLALRLAADPPVGLQGVILVASFARAPVRFPAWLAKLVSRAGPG